MRGNDNVRGLDPWTHIMPQTRRATPARIEAPEWSLFLERNDESKTWKKEHWHVVNHRGEATSDVKTRERIKSTHWHEELLLQKIPFYYQSCHTVTPTGRGYLSHFASATKTQKSKVSPHQCRQLVRVCTLDGLKETRRLRENKMRWYPDLLRSRRHNL
jgi:hypothetical protein